jgi:hypothetical protein
LPLANKSWSSALLSSPSATAEAYATKLSA